MLTMKYLRILVLLALMVGSLSPICAQQHEGVPFNGVVTDMLGQPLKGAKIHILQGLVAKSDKQGRFGLTDVQPTDTLHIRYRKSNYDIPVNGRKSIRVRLGDQVTTEEDEELVAWGYGFVKRRESVEVSNGISGEVLRRTGQTSLLNALQGHVPGLNIQPNGIPGQEAAVSMRGINSINSPVTPLFVVDGVIVETLDFVNIYDVDHVEVLKDASIYGSRGANGAILVFTIKGSR